MFKCFIWMLQKYIWMLHNMHVASVCFQVFQMFHTYVASVSSEYCIYLQWLFKYFASVSDAYFRCFTCFGRMLQMFYQDVAKVDMVLHMLQWDPAVARAPSCVTVMHLRRASIGGLMDSCVRETEQAGAGPAYMQEAELARCGKRSRVSGAGN
jgi:hypothetical protein